MKISQVFIENIFMINDRVGHEIILVYNVSFEDKENYTREMIYNSGERASVIMQNGLTVMDFVTGEKVLFPDGLVDKLERRNS